jgi:serine/threonine-protein kinase
MPSVTKKIAGYELLQSLGVGPWGRSFKAKQVSLDRLVHFTLLPPEKDARSVHSMARICAALTHPHLVSGIDLGESERGKFLVTEWLEGPNVGEVVRRGGAIAEERSLEIALAGAHALDYAARSGLVHGGVTPEAIVIAPGGTPKLRGFAADRAATRSDLDWRSPEAKRTGATDVRSDIYSLGGVLYWILAARYPFEDAPPPEVVDGVVVDVPFPLAQANRKLHPATYETVARMMAHLPDDRFSSAGALAEHLESVLRQFEERPSLRPGRIARPGSRRPRSARIRRRRRR